ncbi:MAG TPA: choice-of-anchor Q domain-containing protein [Patescibacteria group bacterium]|nr:choice-of-anchor Q domain-containing protein [Patescibacteria group bacterium]
MRVFDKRLLVISFFIFVLFLVFPRSVFADTTFNVNTTTDAVDNNPGDGLCRTDLGGNPCSLRAAIREANALGGGTTHRINLPAGTYLLTISGTDEDGDDTGDLDMTANINLVGENKTTTIIDGNNADAVIQLISGTSLISNVTVQHGNTPFSSGGGIYVTDGATLTLDNAILKNNTAYYYGGGLDVDGDATVTHTIITDNSALGDEGSDGGGIDIDGSLTLAYSTVSNNHSILGGGIGNYGTMALTNVTITGNDATTTGGGLYNTDGDATIVNVTISGNTAGGEGQELQLDQQVSLKNVILGPTASGDVCGGNIADIISNGHNISSDLSCGLSEPSDRTNTDPLLGSLADNGGSVKTMALLTGSPAIDTGTNTGCPDLDARGITRPQHNVCDMGAYEFELDYGSPTGPNLALASNGGSIAGFSGNFGDGWDVSFLIDDRTDLGWAGLENETTDQYVIVRLKDGVTHTINHVRLDPGATSGDLDEDGMKNFQIKVSTTDTDPGSFTTVFTGTAPETNALFDYSFSNVSAKYVMLFMSDNYGESYMEAAELEVYGPDGGGSGSGGPSVGAPVCNSSAPSNAPNLYKIVTSNSGTAKLLFTNIANATGYQVFYGYKPGDAKFGVNLPMGLSYTVNSLNPFTKYYFEVRAVNGCAGGPLSNWLSGVTGGAGAGETRKLKGPNAGHPKPSVSSPGATNSPLNTELPGAPSGNIFSGILNFFKHLLNI